MSLFKVYNAGLVFGRREAVGWRGVRTGVGQYWETGEWVRRAVNFDSRDRSIRRREGQVRAGVTSATVLSVKVFPTVRAAAIGTNILLNDSNERDKNNTNTVTF